MLQKSKVTGKIHSKRLHIDDIAPALHIGSQGFGNVQEEQDDRDDDRGVIHSSDERQEIRNEVDGHDAVEKAGSEERLRRERCASVEDDRKRDLCFLPERERTTVGHETSIRF